MLVGCGGGDDGATPPAADATKLVPRDALVYLHLSTDKGRGATTDALKIAQEFPGFAKARRSIVNRLQAPGCKVDTGKGKEAALALLDGAGGTAGSLVLVDTGDDKKVADRDCGTVTVAKIGRFAVVGQPDTIAEARKLGQADGKGSLADDALYKRGLGELPEDRVLDAWVTRDGVRRLLAPQPGLLGAAGTLLDQPALRAASASLSADGEDKAHIVVKSILTKAGANRTSPFQPFSPKVQDDVPASAFGYLGIRGLGGAAGRLLPLLGGGAAQLAPLLKQAGSDLSGLARLFSGEVGITLTKATPAPTLTLIARTSDTAAAARVMQRARPVIARLLKRSGSATPAWKQLGDTWDLQPAPGIEIAYGVFDGKVVASTKAAGVDAVRVAKRHLPQSAAWRDVVANGQNPITSLVFLDFNQLLRLAEQTGLNDSNAYLAVKNDLQRVRTVGARSSTAQDETTAELFLSIP